MSDRRQTLFPSFELSVELGATQEPLLLDGMEVLFDQTVGLYPVTLEPTEPEAADAPGRRAAR